MIRIRFFSCLVALGILSSCTQKSGKTVPVVGFVDAFEDATLAQARKGFEDALKKAGYSEQEGTVKILYRNAQGDIPALGQIVSYYVSQQVDLMATCPTLSTITAVQKSKSIPVFMMVSPMPALMKLEGATGKAPANLLGTGEELGYIDTSFTLIPALVKPKGPKLVIGMIYNQSEPQSVDALNRIKSLAQKLDVTLEALPVNNSSEAQLVTKALLSKNIDAFFANPDNTVFAAFETILKNCDQYQVPVFTSEAGLVARGAVAAFGADLYQWGYQTGEQAAVFLKQGNTSGLAVEMVKKRNRVYNAAAATRFQLRIPEGYSAVH